MRKILSVLITLMLVFTMSAFAEEVPQEAPAVPMIELDFGHFTMTIPEEMVGTSAEEIVSNQPFIQLFQDYSEMAAFNKNLNIVWSNEVLDLNAIDPVEYANAVLSATVAQYGQIGVAATNPLLLNAELSDHDGKPALGVVYSLDLDYSGLGVEEQQSLYTVQLYVPDAAFEGTYIITVTTDDMENTQQLFDVADSIKWAE